MGHPIKTLILEANGFGWRPILVDTIGRGILGIRDIESLPGWLQNNSFARRALKFHNERLSYVIDWREALCDSPDLDVTVCNINNLVSYARTMKTINEYDMVIVLHSAAGNDMTVLLNTAKWFLERKGKLVVFIGNEYDLMTEKITFLRETHADYVCSQLPISAATWLYSGSTEARILEMPHALNPKLYTPGTDQERCIDLGFRGMAYPLFIGDTTRQQILDYFVSHQKSIGLNIDIRFEKLNRKEWAQFLRSCWGLIGAEAGTQFLDREGRMITLAKQYLRKHPHATLEEIQELFLQSADQFVSGKAISSRHFEPVGTKTCQVLLEGEYNGILKPDVHYISIKRDFSNIPEVMQRFKNPDYRKMIVEQTYEYVMGAHTYRHRVEKLISTIAS